MGVIYKLKSEVKEAIITEKKNNPHLSCRKLIDVIEIKYKVKVSKSSVNSLIREAGLSLPVGRRGIKVKEKPAQIPPIPMQPSGRMDGMGGVFLKAADYLLGGTMLMAEMIRKKISKSGLELLAKTEYLVYKQLGPSHWLSLFLDQDITAADNLLYLNDLQQVINISRELSGIVKTIIYPVRVMKFTLTDNSVFYVDGEWHTIWSSPNTPLDFSTTLLSARKYIKKYFQENSPCLLFMAPPEDHPPEAFLNFISGMQRQEKKLYDVTLYGDKLEILETINLGQAQEYKFLFGLWPWQFSRDRVVKKIGEFKPFHFEPLNTTFHIADIEIVLTQHPANQSVTLKGVALKTDLNEKIRLVILSNNNQLSVEELTGLYLSHWPNLEECLNDFNRKIESFAYVTDNQPLSMGNLNLWDNPPVAVQDFFDGYLKVLDLHVKRFFLPASCQNEGFSTIKENFYALTATITQEQNTLLIRFITPAEYKFSAELEYACRRVNERQVVLKDNLRLWLSCG